MLGRFGKNDRLLGIVLRFGIFSRIYYSAPIMGLTQENFMPPPLWFRNFRVPQMAISFIEIYHKSSTIFQ